MNMVMIKNKYPKLAENMIEFRNKRGMSQTELAKKVGSSQRGISNYEIGEREPDFEILLRLGKFMGFTLFELTGNSLFKNIESDSKNAYNELSEDLKVLVDEIIKLPEDDYRRKAIEALLLGQKEKE